MGFPRRLKDPNATLDFPFDWSLWLADGETLVTAVIDAPVGITVEGDPAIVTSEDGVPASVAVVFLSGGTVGQKYDVRCHIETSEGRTDDRSITVVIKER